MKRKLFCVIIIVGLSFLFGCHDNSDYIFEADAGPDQNITTGSLVMLDGSSSYNSSGSKLTYLWAFDSLPEGSNATLSDQSVVNPTFIADVGGVYLLTLEVSDEFGSTWADSINLFSSPVIAKF